MLGQSKATSTGGDGAVGLNRAASFSDADIVLFDPNERWTIRAAEQHSRVDYSLFEGFQVQGRVEKTFLRGNLIVDGDQWLGREGMGEFLKRGQSGRL